MPDNGDLTVVSGDGIQEHAVAHRIGRISVPRGPVSSSSAGPDVDRQKHADGERSSGTYAGQSGLASRPIRAVPHC
tara:strand:- start:6947 stop:7174 length:228 start_codon:yes stop_codon:yes gene_type:complete